MAISNFHGYKRFHLFLELAVFCIRKEKHLAAHLKIYFCPHFAFMDAFLRSNPCTCVCSKTSVKSRSSKALIIFYHCCVCSTVALQQLLQSYFCLFFSIKKCLYPGILTLKSCAFSMAGSQITSRRSGLWREYIFTFWRNTLGDRVRVWHYILIHNRYSQMRNFCTTIATSVSED